MALNQPQPSLLISTALPEDKDEKYPLLLLMTEIYRRNIDDFDIRIYYRQYTHKQGYTSIL